MRDLEDRVRVRPVAAEEPFVRAFSTLFDDGVLTGRTLASLDLSRSERLWNAGIEPAPYPVDCDLLQSYLERAGATVVRGEVSDVRLVGRRLLVHDQPIDAIATIWGEILNVLEVLDADDPVFVAVQRGWVRVLDRYPYGLLAADKRLLAVLSEPERYGVVLEPEAAAELGAAIPWTRVLGPRESTFDGRRIDLLGFVLAHQNDLALKQPLGLAAEGVLLGWELDKPSWTRAVRLAAEQKWIVQERLVAPRMPNVSLADGTAIEQNWDLAAFWWPVDSQVTLGQVRLSPTQLTNVAAGGSVLGVYQQLP
jgi:hypothetical protein